MLNVSPVVLDGVSSGAVDKPDEPGIDKNLPGRICGRPPSICSTSVKCHREVFTPMEGTDQKSIQPFDEDSPRRIGLQKSIRFVRVGEVRLEDILGIRKSDVFGSPVR